MSISGIPITARAIYDKNLQVRYFTAISVYLTDGVHILNPSTVYVRFDYQCIIEVRHNECLQFGLRPQELLGSVETQRERHLFLDGGSYIHPIENT